MTKRVKDHPGELLHLLSQRVDGWMEEFGWLLVPPFSEFRRDHLFERIRRELHVDAASLYLTEEGAPNQLKFASGVGYRTELREKVYYLNQAALTSYVFSTQTAINMSAEELDPQRRKGTREGVRIPFTGRCKDYIETGEFRNIVAVPVVFEKNPLGVLKLENKKGTKASERFPPEDFALAKILAHMIAIACQQRIYTQLWTEGESIAATSQTLDEYLDRVADILRKALNAECCSVFVEDHQSRVAGNGVLRYGGGIGYKADYAHHTYQLPAGAEPIIALTPYLANKRTAIRGSEKELLASGLPYSGRCREYIVSGTFRNLLGIALVESEASFGKQGAQCWGVLKLENRNPEGTDFGSYDLEVCKAFVIKQIVPTLKRLEKSPGLRRPRVAGSEVLVQELGPSVPRGDSRWDERLEKVLAVQERLAGIRDEDCAKYLGVGRATYCRRKQNRKETRGRQGQTSEN